MYIAGLCITAYGLATPLPWLGGMSQLQPARTSGRRTRPTVLAVLVVLVVLVAVLGHRPLDVSASAAPPTVSEPSGHRSEDRGLGNFPGRPQRDRHGAGASMTGRLPDGVTVFDDDVPAVANLDPDLLVPSGRLGLCR